MTDTRYTVVPMKILGRYVRHTEWTQTVDAAGTQGLKVRHSDDPIYAQYRGSKYDPNAVGREDAFDAEPQRREYTNGWETWQYLKQPAEGWAVIDTLTEGVIMGTFETRKKADASAVNHNKSYEQYLRYADLAIAACRNPQAHPPVDGMTAKPGDIVLAYGQQRERHAVVVEGKPGSKNIKVMWTTPSALDQAARYGYTPVPVTKSVKRETGC